MSEARLPVGCYIRIEKSGLQAILDRLLDKGYRVIGPRIESGSIVLDEIHAIEELPEGYVEEQDAATYRLRKGIEGMVFDHVVGPHSLKNFLFPPRATILKMTSHNGDGWHFETAPPPEKPLAVIGVRSCDLHALAMQDRIFLEDRFPNQDYAARREGLFILAVHCGRAAPTCFCTSMNTGPAATGGFDLALSELPTHYVLEIGTERGGEIAAAAEWSPCNTREIGEAQQVPRRAERMMENRRQAVPGSEPGAGRYLETSGLHDLLLNNLEDEHWDKVAERCLACGNCTMVCPTCFCATVQEVTDLTGTDVRRERVWDCCFTAEHSYMNSGTVRKSTRARYRQWLTHKLASWIDQFGRSGCVGCGRCITWCPVGIDLTAEVTALRGGTT